MAEVSIKNLSIYIGDDRDDELRIFFGFKEPELKKGLLYFVKSEKKWWPTTDGKPIKTMSLTEIFMAKKKGSTVKVTFGDEVRQGLYKITIEK